VGGVIFGGVADAFRDHVLGLRILFGRPCRLAAVAEGLGERVDDATVIVVAKIGDIHARSPSPIAGVGEVWEVSLQVSRTLKGSMPASARVTFVDVAVQDRAEFQPSQERLWLLKGTTSTALLSAPASYESVLALSEEPGVAALLRSPAAPQPARR
jgi:hypothetical protein